MATAILPYTADEIPTSKTFELEGKQYKYFIQYNDRHDYYTMTVRDSNDVILYTTKLVYLNDALHAGHCILDLLTQIIPFDVDENTTRASINNFGTVVEIYAVS
jgi:hypothetical protein